MHRYCKAGIGVGINLIRREIIIKKLLKQDISILLVPNHPSQTYIKRY